MALPNKEIEVPAKKRGPNALREWIQHTPPHSTFTLFCSSPNMPAIPHILLLCVPVFASLIVIAALLSSKPVSTNTRAEYQCRPVAPYLVWISLTLLAVLTASFGVISDQHNGQILWITVAEGVFLSLLKTERRVHLSLSRIYPRSRETLQFTSVLYIS